MDCDNKLLKEGLTNPVACGLRQTARRRDEQKPGAGRGRSGVLGGEDHVCTYLGVSRVVLLPSCILPLP